MQELIVNSNNGNLQVLRKFVEEHARDLSLNVKDRANLVFCVLEAAANAVNHGNKNNRDKQVRIVFDDRDDRVVVDVEDEGNGFDPELVPDPTRSYNISTPGGRGVFFMKQMMDEVKFRRTDTGFSVTLVKFKH